MESLQRAVHCTASDEAGQVSHRGAAQGASQWKACSAQCIARLLMKGGRSATEGLELFSEGQVERSCASLVPAGDVHAGLDTSLPVHFLTFWTACARRSGHGQAYTGGYKAPPGTCLYLVNQGERGQPGLVDGEHALRQRYMGRQSVCQVVVRQLATQSVHQINRQSVSQSIDQSAGQPDSRSVRQSVS
eukprot:1159665-Pelagomonas_calceolata.AAC.1